MDKAGFLCVGVILVIFAGTTHGMKCYVCNSLTEPNCKDQFDSSGINSEDNCGQCMKTKGEAGGNQVVVRSCNIMALGNDGDCHEESSGGGEATICFCNKENCNGTPHMRIAFATIVTSVLLAFRVL